MNHLPVRKKIRLEKYDYSQDGCYFITICTMQRRSTLGQIVGDASTGVPFMSLSKVGESIKECIENTCSRGGVELDKFTIMPNHVHLLIHLYSGMQKDTVGCRPFQQSETATETSPTNAIPKLMNVLKSLTSRLSGSPLWQRSYYEHVIRNEDDYLRVWQYIDENPLKWYEDEYYTGRL